jgi:hypothetical protein
LILILYSELQRGWTLWAKSFPLLSELSTQLNVMSLSQLVSHRCPRAGNWAGQMGLSEMTALIWWSSCYYIYLRLCTSLNVSQFWKAFILLHLKYKNYKLSMKTLVHCIHFEWTHPVPWIGIHSVPRMALPLPHKVLGTLFFIVGGAKDGFHQGVCPSS